MYFIIARFRKRGLFCFAAKKTNRCLEYFGSNRARLKYYFGRQSGVISSYNRPFTPL